MTISAYVGLPGQGKSYGVVENIIIPAITSGRRVLTNIPMVKKEWIYRYGVCPEEFNRDDYQKNPDFWNSLNPAGAVFVIDELWAFWPSGQSAKSVRESDKTFLAQHRHLVDDKGNATEIILVTQDLSQVASFARVLVETTFRVSKLSKLGLNKKFRVDVYSGAVTGHAPPKSRLDRQDFGFFKKSTYALYTSHTMSLTGGAGNETRIDKRFNVLGSFAVKFSFVFVLFLCFFSYYSFQKYYSSYQSKPTASLTQTATPTPIQNSTLPSSQTTGVQLQQPVNSQALHLTPPKPNFEFLSKAESIHIVWNNGHFPLIEYRFKVSFSDQEIVFTSKELAALKYKLKPINDCLVFIKGEDFDQWAACPRSGQKKKMLDGIVPTPIPSAPPSSHPSPSV